MEVDITDLDVPGVRAEDVLDAVGCSLVVLDGDGVIVDTNRMWRSLHGDVGAVGERYLDRHQAAGGDLDLVLAEGIERVLAGRSQRFDIEFRTDSPSDPQWNLLVATPVLRGAGAVVAIIDVTAQHDVSEILDGTAHRDHLTGLPNRRAITQRLKLAIAEAEELTTTVSAVFIDLNGFKAVNDGLGHDAGDEVLAAVGRRLGGTIRSDDVLGRWGGDEFVVVVTDGDAARALPLLADRLHAAVACPVAIRGSQQVSLGLAVGAAEVRPGESAEDLLARADEAMYEAKRTGQGIVIAS